MFSAHVRLDDLLPEAMRRILLFPQLLYILARLLKCWTPESVFTDTKHLTPNVENRRTRRKILTQIAIDANILVTNEYREERKEYRTGSVRDVPPQAESGARGKAREVHSGARGDPVQAA